MQLAIRYLNNSNKLCVYKYEIIFENAEQDKTHKKLKDKNLVFQKNRYEMQTCIIHVLNKMIAIKYIK